MDEQRHDYPDILKRLEKIENQTNGGLKAQFDDLKSVSSEHWKQHDEEARDFRVEIRGDIREIVKNLTERPCVVHTEQIKSLVDSKKEIRNYAMACITAFLGMVILGLIGYGQMIERVKDAQYEIQQLRYKVPYLPKTIERRYIPSAES